jgi:hypothetical protein
MSTLLHDDLSDDMLGQYARAIVARSVSQSPHLFSKPRYPPPTFRPQCRPNDFRKLFSTYNLDNLLTQNQLIPPSLVEAGAIPSMLEHNKRLRRKRRFQDKILLKLKETRLGVLLLYGFVIVMLSYTVG